MWTMGADNWIRYGWGTSMKNEWHPGAKLVVDFSRYDPKINEAASIDAAVLAVRDITETFPAPYTLMCSGGIDSQAMIWAWHMAKVPFNIVSVKYISDDIFFNDYDLVQLGEFCSRHNFQVDYKDFDLIPFLENELSKVASTNDCDSPQICTYIKMTELVPEGTLCFSGNFLLGRMTPGGFNYTLLGLHRYALLSKTATRAIIPFFFLHHPILATSFNQFSAYRLVDSLYQRAGYPVIPQASKFNGFEKIKEFYDKFTERVSAFDRLRFSAKPSKRVFDLLFRYPYEGVGDRYKCSVPVKQIVSKKE